MYSKLDTLGKIKIIKLLYMILRIKSLNFAQINCLNLIVLTFAFLILHPISNPPYQQHFDTNPPQPTT
jgi:hypothetical protein